MVNWPSVVTAVVTTSPIPSHPSTAVIDETYESIRHHFPTIPIMILADGVREEQTCWKERYATYLQSINQKEWPGVQIHQFQKFMHQAGMIRETLNQVRTPLILWIEHDLPLVKDHIPWEGIIQALLDNAVSSVRFVLDDVRKPYYERGDFTTHGVTLTRTVEYSSLPNIARKDLYEFIVPHFKTAQIHLECSNICGLFHDDRAPQWPLSIYHAPDGRPREYSLDGRSVKPVKSARPCGPKLPMRF